VRRAQNAGVQNAGAQVQPEQTQDRFVQNTQAPWLMPFTGRRN
jgi:hypothetical protein